MDRQLPPLASRLQRARLNAGLSQAQLAEQMGVSTRMIRYYESGRKQVSLDKLPFAAAATGVPIEWFFHGTDRTVPLYDDVPAGQAADAVPHVQDRIYVPAQWTAGDGDVYCLRIRGNSMEPGLQAGDIVVVRRQSVVENGHIVVASVPGVAEAREFTVKRYFRHGKKIVLRADNPAFDDIVPQGPVFIEGRVLGLLRNL